MPFILTLDWYATLGVHGDNYIRLYFALSLWQFQTKEVAICVHLVLSNISRIVIQSMVPSLQLRIVFFYELCWNFGNNTVLLGTRKFKKKNTV